MPINTDDEVIYDHRRLSVAEYNSQVFRVKQVDYAVLRLAATLVPTAGFSCGQAVSGTLLGTITDSNFASVPAAKVTITEQNTGVSRVGETQQSGYYAFSDLANAQSY